MPTILVADDYLDALQVWELYLQAAGFHVLTAQDGTTALELITSALPDLAVMDLEMPGLSGHEVARALRAQAATRHIPLIAATGHSQPRQIALAKESGFELVLIKPCDPDDLVAHIKRLLAEHPNHATATE